MKNLPIITYYNTDHLKAKIFKDNNKKSGIYRWYNKINNKTYIGSAVNLTERLRHYFAPESLKKYLLKSRSLISKSLLKYGYSKFSLEILEYCKPELLIEREQYYMDLLKPEYNICKVAGSTLGKKHTKETIEKLKLSSNSVIFITNVKDSSKIEYYYAHEAAKHLNVCVRTLYNYTDTGKLLKDIYLINRVYKK